MTQIVFGKEVMDDNCVIMVNTNSPYWSIKSADRLGSYKKILSQGLDTSEEAFAKDAYKRWNDMLQSYEEPPMDIA